METVGSFKLRNSIKLLASMCLVLFILSRAAEAAPPAPQESNNPASASAGKVWYWNQRYYCPGDPGYGNSHKGAVTAPEGEYITEAEAVAAHVIPNGINAPCGTKLRQIATCNGGKHVFYYYNTEQHLVETAWDVDGHQKAYSSGTNEKGWVVDAGKLATFICGQVAPSSFHGPVSEWDADFKLKIDAQVQAMQDEKLARIKKSRETMDCRNVKSAWDKLTETEKARELTATELQKKAYLSAGADMSNCGKLDEPW